MHTIVYTPLHIHHTQRPPETKEMCMQNLALDLGQWISSAVYVPYVYLCSVDKAKMSFVWTGKANGAGVGAVLLCWMMLGDVMAAGCNHVWWYKWIACPGWFLYNSVEAELSGNLTWGKASTRLLKQVSSSSSWWMTNVEWIISPVTVSPPGRWSQGALRKQLNKPWWTSTLPQPLRRFLPPGYCFDFCAAFPQWRSMTCGLVVRWNKPFHPKFVWA